MQNIFLKRSEKNSNFEETLNEVLKQYGQQDRKITKRLYKHKAKYFSH